MKDQNQGEKKKSKFRSIFLIVILLLIIFFSAAILLIGIFSGGNRPKAQDASVKATISSMIPEALIYADKNKDSFDGYIPVAVYPENAIKCSGRPIVNISQDGKSIAAFGKLCSDPNKYFCADDKGKSGEVSKELINSTFCP